MWIHAWDECALYMLYVCALLLPEEKVSAVVPLKTGPVSRPVELIPIVATHCVVVVA